MSGTDVVDRIASSYYQDSAAQVFDGINLDALETAAGEHRRMIQDVWDGGAIPRLPIVNQPTCRSWRRPDALAGFVYHDALHDQLLAILESIEQGYLVIPMALCDFNTAPVSALFNAELIEDQDVYTRPTLTSRQQVEGLSPPDTDSGLVRIMVRESERLRRVLPPWMDVGVRLNTGPLSVAAELRGTTDLLYDMLEAPALYHDFMSIVTDTYIGVRRRIHEASGIRIASGVVRPDVSVHMPTTGVMICDDTIQLFSPDLFERCAAPYLNRVFETFGGGCLHSCGDLTHLLPTIADMPRLHAVEFGQASLVDWRTARRALPDKVLIFFGAPDGERTTHEQALRQLQEPRTFMYTGVEAFANVADP